MRIVFIYILLNIVFDIKIIFLPPLLLDTMKISTLSKGISKILLFLFETER